MACLVHDRARVLQDFVGIKNYFTHLCPLTKSGNTSLIHEDRTRRTSAWLNLNLTSWIGNGNWTMALEDEPFAHAMATIRSCRRCLTMTVYWLGSIT
jgi:hypothetical protein